MHVDQLCWTEASGWSGQTAGQSAADLVLYFGAGELLARAERYDELREMFPAARILGCSTAGQIVGDDIDDDLIVTLAIRFEATRLRLACETVTGPEQSQACGEAIGRALAADDLAGVFVLGEGLQVRGDRLIAGIAGAVGPKVPLSGGLAGDGGTFVTTLVGADCAPRSRLVAAVGFYGDAIRLGHGCAGGWDAFGPRRRITRSESNVLFELDGEPALDLYERYLGEEEASGLPRSGLMFPLLLRDPARPDSDVVRAVNAIDREARSMTFAADLPTGWTVQLMRGSFDGLTAAAATAARQAALPAGDACGDGLAVLVSCVARRMVFGQQAQDEIEAAASELGPRMRCVGFYSYGEIAPHPTSGISELHHQTMTITTIAEITG